MHSNKSSLIIGVSAIAIDLVLFVVYWYFQATHTFGYLREILLR